MRYSVLAVAALLLACAESQDDDVDDTAPVAEQPASGDTNAAPPPVAASCRGDARIAGDRVGDLQLGMTPATVRRDCNVVRDTTLALEGEDWPALVVALGSDTVIAEIVNDMAWRLRVLTPGLFTRDSLHARMAARDLAVLNDAAILTGEGNTMVIAEQSHCGLSFGLEGLPARNRRLTVADLATLPDSTHVGLILVLGRCHDGG